jgi:nitrite reductase/ring-hydroxylating ferredoxin subunit
MSDRLLAVADASAIAPGAMRRVQVGGEEIALYNVGGQFYATANLCTHDEACLSDGELFGNVVECPLHGARFDVRTGKALSLPAVYPVKSYPVEVVDGKIHVRM